MPNNNNDNEQNNSVVLKAISEIIDFAKRAAPLALFIASVYVFAYDWLQSFIELPTRVASIEEKIDGGEIPFIEFLPIVKMFPDEVYAGEEVTVAYYLKRNRQCNTLVKRRFQKISEARIDNELTNIAPAITPPLTLNFEVFSTTFKIPQDIEPGYYAYRPVLTCKGEPSVIPPPVFFKVIP